MRANFRHPSRWMGMQLKAVVIVESAQSQHEGDRVTPWLTALEHVANRPIVHHVLDDLMQANVDRVMVAGDTMP